MLALDPKALGHLSAQRSIALVSGTNGKTTTTRLLASAMSAACSPGNDGAVASNFQGANLPSGLVTALAAAGAGAPAVLEVDEAWLPEVAAQVRPAAVVLLNLSRDQLDRHHEVRQLAQRWRALCQVLPATTAVVANADDPLVAWAAAAAPRVTWVAGGARWRMDATGCPECGGRLVFAPGPDGRAVAPEHEHAEHDVAGDGEQEHAEQEHAGDDVAGRQPARSALLDGGTQGAWRCDSCGLRRPEPDLWLSAGEGAPVVACWRTGRRLGLTVSLPGRCNQSNALMALAAATQMDVSEEVAAAALAGVSEVAGRYSMVSAGGSSAKLLLAKNPAGWVEALDMLAPAPAPVIVAINAHGVDGRDTSWIWDVPFENLKGRRVTASGERALDMSVRLHYADVDHAVEADLWEAIRGFGATAVDVVANYSAFQRLYSKLNPAGGAASTGSGGPSPAGRWAEKLAARARVAPGR